ncbi:putative oxidoreductase [Helianthus anomalus]
MCVLQEAHYFMVTLSVYDDMGNNRSVGKRLTSLIAMALNLEDAVFEKVGALDKPYAFLRLLHYPGEVGDSDEVVYGASAHSDYGMVCREEHKQPRIWEDVRHIKGAFIINLGDMMERWTNCLFRSTLHRVMPTGKERYSMALFLDPNPDCIVECLKSCCSDSSPPRYVCVHATTEMWHY